MEKPMFDMNIGFYSLARDPLFIKRRITTG